MDNIDILISGCSEEVRHELSQIITRAILAESPAAVSGIVIYTVEELERIFNDSEINIRVAQRLKNRGWEVL